MKTYEKIIAVIDTKQENNAVNGINRRLYRITWLSCRVKTIAGINTAIKYTHTRKVWACNGHVPSISTSWELK